MLATLKAAQQHQIGFGVGVTGAVLDTHRWEASQGGKLWEAKDRMVS